jgi:hypothetical protein
MRKERHVGRWSVRRPAGRARVGQAVGRAPTPDRAHTEVLRIGSEPRPPVFVDPGGTRRRRLRPIGYVVAAAILVILLLLWVSQLGGTARPPAAPCVTADAGSASPDGTDCRR